MPPDPILIDPPPDPPTTALRSYVFIGGLGILHLVLAALVECLQMLNLVLGLVEILYAVVTAVQVSRWRKRMDEWLARQGVRSTPPPPSAPR